MKKNLKTIDTLRERERERESYNLKNKNCKGVTLIALIITIIILLILAVTSVVLVMRWNIVEKTEMAAEGYQGVSERDAIGLAYKEWTLNDDENANLNMEGQAEVNGYAKEERKGWTVKFPSGNVYTVDDEGDIWEAVQVTVEGKGEEPVILTEDNVAEYLGKEVTDFKENGSGTGGTETVPEVEGKEGPVTVSTTYRLYYVDFDNKYGEGKGTIYLKADCDGTTCNLPTTDTTSADDSNIKIKDLNPGLYKAGVDAPSKDNDNMKAVTWLLNTDNWEELNDTISDEYKSKVKYIVGAPSLEMMMDSYNTHYGLTIGTPVNGREKLFYQYPYNGGSNNNCGYGVGPSSQGLSSVGHATFQDSVKTDQTIDSMYFPGSKHRYWLGSPSCDSPVALVYVFAGNTRICELHRSFW